MKLNDRIASARELTFVGFFIILGFAIYLSYQAGKRHIINGLDYEDPTVKHDDGAYHTECYAQAMMIDKEWNPKTKHWE
jgi:hypothetical protein